MRYLLLTFVVLWLGCAQSSSSPPNAHNVSSSVTLINGIDYGYSAFIDMNDLPMSSYAWDRWLGVIQPDGTLTLNIGVKNPADGKIDPVQHIVITNVPNMLGTHTGCRFRYQPHSTTGTVYATPTSSSPLTVTLTSIANNSGEIYEGSFIGPIECYNASIGGCGSFTTSGSFRLLKK